MSRSKYLHSRRFGLTAGIVVFSVLLGGTAAYAEDRGSGLRVGPFDSEVRSDRAVLGTDQDGEHSGDFVRGHSATEGHELDKVLRSVNDDQGEPASSGSIESQHETTFVADDESGTQISIGGNGVVALSAEGNPGFEVRFDDTSSPLGRDGEDGPLAYDTGNDAAMVPQIIETHFRGVFVLLSTASPTEYVMSVSNGDIMNLAPSDDGGVVFHDAAGEEIGGFAAPWAKDAKNRPVPTRFEIDGQRVRQVIDTSNLTPADFPVVADPPVYVNYTKTSVIELKDHGNVAKWKYLNECSAAKNKTCSIGRNYQVYATVQTSLNVSAAYVGGQIGVTGGASTDLNVTCSVKGPGRVTLYASANKKTYKVRTVRTYGVSPQTKSETKTSGTLTSYKPNGKYACV